MNLPKPKQPKTIREFMPMNHFKAMGNQSPQMPGRKLATRKYNSRFDTMNFYYK
jgi:hypothetical protein